jgi:PAS domain S-box-containing protein
MPTDFAAEVQRLAALMDRTHEHPADIAARLERFDAAVLVADNEAHYVAANQRAARLTGFSVQQLLTLTVADLTPVPYTVDFESLWREFMTAGAQKGTYQLRRQDGSVVQVHYAAWAHIAPGRHVTVLTPAESSHDRNAGDD